MWWRNDFPPCNFFQTNETLLICRYISLINLNTLTDMTNQTTPRTYRQIISYGKEEVTFRQIVLKNRPRESATQATSTVTSWSQG